MSYKYIQASLQSVFLKNWFLLKKTNFFFYNFQYSCIRSDQRNLKTSDWTKNREADFFFAIFKKIKYLNCICVLITFWKRQRRFSYIRFEISFLGFIPNGCLTYSYPGHFEPRTLIILQKYKTKLISQVKKNN